jgi:hypothetical protein
MKATWGLASLSDFHFSPFKWFHVNPVTGKEMRIYDEVYKSDAWIEAYNKLQKEFNKPGCKLEIVIAGLMFWSLTYSRLPGDAQLVVGWCQRLSSILFRGVSNLRR